MKLRTSKQLVFILINIFIIIETTQCKINDFNTKLYQTQSRQNSFLQWILSIFQFPPINIKPPTSVTLPPPTLPTTKPQQCVPCSCGTANTVNRIVGGEETQEIQYPWMALLMTNGRFYCGGSLVSNLYVVTAAHCLRGFLAPLLSVRFLVHDRQQNNTREIYRRVTLTYVHEQYNPATINNDIGIIRLSEPVEMSDVLRPVCMPTAETEYTGETAVISGWGATSEGGPLSNRLMQVSVPIISNEDCNEKYGENRITEFMLCAGIDEGNKDACQGDSGGPLHVFTENLDIYRLVGVVSWGDGCARPNKPGVYTRVTKYLDWIDRHIMDSCKCEMPTKKLIKEELFIKRK